MTRKTEPPDSTAPPRARVADQPPASALRDPIADRLSRALRTLIRTLADDEREVPGSFERAYLAAHGWAATLKRLGPRNAGVVSADLLEQVAVRQARGVVSELREQSRTAPLRGGTVLSLRQAARLARALNGVEVAIETVAVKGTAQPRRLPTAG